MLDSGDSIPDLPIVLSSGRAARLSDYQGRWLALYFYPKDSTPGCTMEALDFTALLPEFRRLGAEVLGVSRDSLQSHQNFCSKQGLGFDLVSDTDQALCDAFGVIREKNMYGRKVPGIERSTFLIGPRGVVRQSWRKVRVPGHARDVLDALAAAQSR